MHVPRQDRLDIDPATLVEFAGLRVIGDVHGAFDAFDRALSRAEADGVFVVQLGDLVDRGPWSPLCAERMLEVEARGLGAMVVGNHDADLASLVRDGSCGAVGRQATLMQFEEHGVGLLDRFVDRVASGPLWIVLGSCLFVHAAFHPRMLRPGEAADATLRSVALDGYVTARERRDGSRARGWVDAVPSGMTVVVGHAVTPSRAVETARGRLGGTAVFADTGWWLPDGGEVPVLDLPLPGREGTGVPVVTVRG